MNPHCFFLFDETFAVTLGARKQTIATAATASIAGRTAGNGKKNNSASDRLIWRKEHCRI
jgi:hypothetical protein